MNKKSIERFCLIGLFILLMTIPALAQNKNEDNFEFSHNRVSFSAMLTSSDSYQLEASYHYMLNHYIGLGGAFGYWSVWYEDGWAAEKDWEIESDDNKPYNLYLRPSVVLKTPTLKIKMVDIGMYAEPGMMINIPYASVNIRQYTYWPDYNLKHTSTSRGQWFAVDLRLGVFVNFGSCGFSAGYTMSNFDVYSQYRHLSYQGIPFSKYYSKKSFMQGAFLTASYYF